MKKLRHGLIALIALLVFTQAHINITPPSGIASAQVSVSIVQTVEAATRTFVGDGASHNWSATGAWVEGIVPTAADDVVFSSNVAGSILVIDGTSGSPSLCRSLDTTNYTKTITFGSAKELDVGDGTAGAFKMTAGMTFAPNATSLIKFKSTTTGNNITFGGYTYAGPITFDGVGGAWQFQDTLTGSGTGSLITLTNGSLDTNGKTINGFNLSSSNPNTRSLTLGATSWTLINTAGTSWDISTSTGMTLSAASSTITDPTAAQATVFSGGGLTYGTLTRTAMTSGSLTINGANTFGTLTTSNGANANGKYILGASQTVSGTWTAAGNSNVNRVVIVSDTKGTARTMSAGTFTFSNINLQDTTKAGAGSGNLSGITGGSGDLGGNTGWTLSTPKNCYMKTAVSVNWSGSNWYSDSSPRTTLCSPSIPLAQDTAIIDGSSVTAGSVTITVDGSSPYLPAMNWTGVTNSPTFSLSGSSTSVFGSITLTNGLTLSGNANKFDFEGRGSQTITSAGNTWITNTTVNAPGGTWTLSDAYTNSRTGTTFTVTSGTFAAGSNTFTLSGSTGSLLINGGTMTASGNISLTGSTSPVLTVSSGTLTASGTTSLSGTTAANITVSGGTFDASSGTVSMTGAGSTMTLSGGAFKAGTLTRTGLPLTISGSTVTIGSGGIAYSGVLTISSGTLVPATGYKFDTLTATAIPTAASSSGGSCSFGQLNQWPSIDAVRRAVNDNHRKPARKPKRRFA